MLFHAGYSESSTNYWGFCARPRSASCRPAMLRERAEFRAIALHGWRAV